MAWGSAEYFKLFPLLEQPYDAVTANLQRQLDDHTPAACARADDISLSELVAAALRSDSSYWHSAAVEWLEQGLPFDPLVADAVRACLHSSFLSQRARHSASTLLARWERRLTCR